MAYSVAAASALTAVGAAPAFAADEGADLILRGGTIRPLPGAPIASALARLAHGNVYVNRNMIGAVVGAQPFGQRPVGDGAEGRRT